MPPTVDESKVLPSFTERLKTRLFNDPERLRHLADNLFFGQEDNVCDYVPNTYPGFENTLKEAKTIDREKWMFPVVGQALSALHKEKTKKQLIKAGFKRQPDDNCKGLRSWP
jgi:hypothetical protein